MTARPRALLAFVAACAHAALDSSTQLTTLSHEHRVAPWVPFVEAGEQKAVHAWSKMSEDSGVAVLKVSVLTEAPMWLVLDLFESQNPDVIAQWNPYTGDVLQLGEATQLQTYKLPWPFMARDYIVTCKNVKSSHDQRQRTHCVPRDTHPAVPPRTDRVRGASETLWQFAPERGADGRVRTRIAFEGIVDPRGRLPKWVVNEIGKRTSVTIVAGLARLADSRWETSAAAGDALSMLMLCSFVFLFVGFNAVAYTAWRMTHGDTFSSRVRRLSDTLSSTLSMPLAMSLSPRFRAVPAEPTSVGAPPPADAPAAGDTAVAPPATPAAPADVAPPSSKALAAHAAAAVADDEATSLALKDRAAADDDPTANSPTTAPATAASSPPRDHAPPMSPATLVERIAHCLGQHGESTAAADAAAPVLAGRPAGS